LPEAVGTSSLVSVSRVLPAESPDGITGFDITFPKPHTAEAVYAVPLEGWVVPADGPAEAVLVHGGRRPVPRAPVVIDRPDIAELYPDVPWAGRAGFATRLNALELPPVFRLELVLRHDDGTRTQLGTIEGERRALPAHETRYRPLLVDTIGRSGSTWFTWLMGAHPDVVDYRSFEYESKVSAYFAEIIRALTRPLSYYQPIRGEVDRSGWWLGHEPNESLYWYTSHDAIDDWLGGEHVEELIEFCTGRIDALFGRLARGLGKEEAAYVIEKMPPGYFGQELISEIIPATREIFLVRDFRDVAASILAFAEKRGRRWFLEHPSASDEQLIREPLRDEVERLTAAWEERRPASFLVHYEDLVLRPEETLAGVLAFLGLDSSPDTIARMLADAARVDGELHGAHITSPSVKDSIGRWECDLDPELKRVCEEVLGEGLRVFGYR
jgi:sulfotransferase family protein